MKNLHNIGKSTFPFWGEGPKGTYTVLDVKEIQLGAKVYYKDTVVGVVTNVTYRSDGSCDFEYRLERELLDEELARHRS